MKTEVIDYMLLYSVKAKVESDDFVRYQVSKIISSTILGEKMCFNIIISHAINYKYAN